MKKNGDFEIGCSFNKESEIIELEKLNKTFDFHSDSKKDQIKVLKTKVTWTTYRSLAVLMSDLFYFNSNWKFSNQLRLLPMENINLK